MPSGPHEQILIVDDEEGIRAVLSALLESIGIASIEAEDTLSAVETLTSHRDSISACLLDMNLEDGYGEDLYDKMKKISPDLPIFAMSGIYGDEIKSRLGDREIAGLISKPFSAVQLIETVSNGIKKSRTSA